MWGHSVFAARAGRRSFPACAWKREAKIPVESQRGPDNFEECIDWVPYCPLTDAYSEYHKSIDGGERERKCHRECVFR